MGAKVLTTPTGKLLQHPGSGMAYSAYGCRCDECKAFNTERNQKRRAERYEMAQAGTIPEGIKHGRATASNWGCKCEVCLDALRASSRQWHKDHYEHVGRKRGESHHNASLTNAQVLAICGQLDSGKRPGDLARDYGVHRTVVSRIKHGRSWSWLTGRGKA